METLRSLINEFAILGGDPSVEGGQVSLELEQEPTDEVEFELDEFGNPVLDADGNPVPKTVTPDGSATAPSCTCDDPTVINPQGSIPAEKDEFNFV